jgi:protein-tyrosine-phosphatase
MEDDDMGEIYRLLRKADLVVVATPIFFYGPPAQLKALIDRSQALWARRYILKLTDPKANFRKGFLLVVGATKGKELFTGTILTVKYFFDAIGASFEGMLGFREIESPGDIALHPTALEEARQKGKELTETLSKRKRVLFLCRENACRSQMAEALLQYYGGNLFDAQSAGDQPAREINPLAVEVMAERGMDLAYRRPKGLGEAVDEHRPFDLVVQMGCGSGCAIVSSLKVEGWDLEDPAGKSIEFMRETRDEIEKRVKMLIEKEGTKETLSEVDDSRRAR